MSISGALSNALSGLSAASRAVSLVSTNIANAMTDGYGRRDIELAARGIGGGVDVVGGGGHRAAGTSCGAAGSWWT